MQFRKDINGLRALAVIGVVLFHFNATWLPGGFAGVDVFFVISGFLMTGIIFKGIEQKNFSIMRFYVARANRIIPALAVLCFVMLLFGWLYLPPLDYQLLGKHALSSISFLSNITYWTEAGYFDAASHEKWLLHTWSLSVEWQFYIIYPLVLVFIHKFTTIKLMNYLIVAATFLGFVFCVFASFNWPNAAYYLLPTRAWEMMIGGVAYLFPIVISNKKKIILERLGLMLIIGSYFIVTKEDAWPGYAALLPVLGAFFVILAARDESFVTGNVVFQKIGAWSYSIYLWHWPLVVGIYYYTLNDIYIFLGIALSILLGFISNRYIEKIRFKNGFHSARAYLKCKPLYIMLFISILSLSVIANKGDNYWVNNLDSTGYKTYSLLFNRDKENDDWGVDSDGGQNFSKCNFNSLSLTDEIKVRLKQCALTSNPGVLIIGDSHSKDLFGMVSSAFENDFIVGITNTQGCRPHTQKKDCQEHYLKIKHFLINNSHIFEHVIYEQAGFYLFLDENNNQGNREMFKKLALTDKVENIAINEVYAKQVSNYLAEVSEAIPVTWFGSRVEPHFSSQHILNKGCAYKFDLRDGHKLIFNELDKVIEEEASALDNVKFLSQNKLIDYNFQEDFMTCESLFWTDGDHLSSIGEEVFGERLPDDFLVF